MMQSDGFGERQTYSNLQIDTQNVFSNEKADMLNFSWRQPAKNDDVNDNNYDAVHNLWFCVVD